MRISTQAASCIAASYFLPRLVDAASTNATIDDNDGDSVTGRQPTYSDSWNYGPDCSGCLVQPDIDSTFDRSWHDVTASPDDSSARNVSISFNGTAIWVYGILPPTIEYATTFVNVTFQLDGQVVGSYKYDPSQSTSAAYKYNVTVYKNASLEYGEHKLVITPRRDVNASYFALDWVQYTYDPDHSATPTSVSSSSSTSTSAVSVGASSHRSVGAIVGGVVGGVAAVVLIVLFLVFWRRHVRSNASDRIHRVEGGVTRNEEIEPMGKPETDVQADVREARSPSLPLMSPPLSAALTSSAVASLSAEDDGLPRGASLAATVSTSAGSPSTIDSPRMVPSAGRRSKNTVQCSELSQQVRDMEEQVAELRRRQSAHSPQPSGSTRTARQTGTQDDFELRRQIEALQLEVERLRGDTLMDEPPPAYEERP